LALLGFVTADLYIHGMNLVLQTVRKADEVLGMRGSNNRNDESSVTRQNANRLFDSQNNNHGGYNRGQDGCV